MTDEQRDLALTTAAFWYKDNTHSFALGDRQMTMSFAINGEQIEFTMGEIHDRAEKIKWVEAQNKAQKFLKGE